MVPDGHGRFHFLILLIRTEKWVLQEYLHGIAGNLACISILALFFILKQLMTKEQRKGVNGH